MTEFERWLKTEYWPEASITKRDGRYTDPKIVAMYEAWNASLVNVGRILADRLEKDGRKG